MNKQNSSKLALMMGMTVATCALVPSDVHAATIVAKFKANGAAVCQAALPSGAGSVLRARPLALQNEGASTAFVTCAFPYDDEPAADMPIAVGVRLVNNTANVIQVTCTLVTGTDSSNANYVPHSIQVPANGGATSIFYPFELPGEPATILAPNLSCGLLPGVGISYVFHYYNQEIGT